MYEFASDVMTAILFMLPVMIVILITQAIRKKLSKKFLWVLAITAGCFWISLFVSIGTSPETDDFAMVDEHTTTQVETTAKTQEPTTKEQETNPPTTAPQNTMVKQFKSLGFTQAEAEEMKDIFATVGITEISNIQFAVGDGIDKLQTFKCDIFDYHASKGGVSVHFTIDKRQLCFISLDGIPTTKADYAYINVLGNVKAKTSNTTTSVTLYDKWDENGEIDENAIGYKAVFDYENRKIENYKQ